MRTINNIQYSKEYDASKLDMHLPDGQGFNTIVYFHGGGLNSGDKGDPQYIEMAKSFVEAGYGFISCNYRMYPNAKFPDYLEDAAKAVAFIINNIKEYGGSGKVIVSGQSAGAWMGAMLMLDKHYLNDAGIDPMDVSGWIIESGQMTSHFNVIMNEDGLNFLSQRIDERAPIYFVDTDTQFTKAIFYYYDDDMPMRKLQNLLLEETIKKFNKEADLETKELPGGHCAGSSFKVNGEYRYVTESLEWLRKKGF